MTTRKKKTAATKTHFRILDTEHESFWEEKKKLPRFMFPREYSLDPCAQCKGLCCSATVHLTMVEALRIHVALTLPFDTFTTLLPAEGDRGSRQSVAIPIDGGPVRLALRQKDEVTGDCGFLLRIGDRALCSIYAFRPGACRVFPYKAELGDLVVSAGPPLPCPTSWLWNDAVAARVQTDMERWLKDLEVEAAIIDAWTKAAVPERTFAAFTRFAIGAAADHLGYDAAAVLAPRRRRLGESLGGGA